MSDEKESSSNNCIYLRLFYIHQLSTNDVSGALGTNQSLLMINALGQMLGDQNYRRFV